MSPLPGWQVIPDGWAEYHRPFAESTMTSLCEVHRIVEGPPPYPKPPGWTGTEVLWSGACRLQELKRENSQVPGLQPVETRDYLVSLPFKNAAGVPLPQLSTGERGDQVHINGRVFRLKQSMDGSELWQNDFTAVENQTQQNP